MEHKIIPSALIGLGLLGVGVGAAAAQVRGSMIPPETLEVSLQRSDRMFDRLDADRDGAITEPEIAAMGQRAQGQGRPGQGGQGPGGPGQGGGRGAGPMGQMFASADSDGDRRITREEMRVSATARFREQDRNGDGLVSSDERPSFPGRPGGGFGSPPSGDQMPPMGDPSGD
ncbi:EF-hand domain-containing protein [Brevundimonas variabilis]|uniref:EF-hand domain-containing protein n=1 Tax=Brevundimonas variabilis TaxID=74312 RepID=A0A7W9FFN0_9CAUL|nr:EF-hand domain-containing protein [Brevundimonas variabilis]MBB5745559.1 hypothetical protein [Brevundimonas variabilis]